MQINIAQNLFVLALAAFFVGSVWIGIKTNAERKEVWGQLAGIISGVPSAGGITGVYKGYTAEVKVVSAKVRYDRGAPTHYFHVVILTQPQTDRGQDWILWYGRGDLPANTPPTWHFVARDDGLKQRLASSGLLATIEAWSQRAPTKPQIIYKARHRTMTCRTYCVEKPHDFPFPLSAPDKIKDYPLPTPEELTLQFDLLYDVIETNRQCNTV